MAAHFVEAALDEGANEELGLFALAVVLDAFGFAIDIFFLAFALLAEAGEAAGAAVGDALLEAVGILGDHQLVGADDEGALNQLDIALEDVLTLGVINGYFVGFEIYRFFPVAFFRLRRQGEQQGETRDETQL